MKFNPHWASIQEACIYVKGGVPRKYMQMVFRKNDRDFYHDGSYRLCIYKKSIVESYTHVEQLANNFSMKDFFI